MVLEHCDPLDQPPDHPFVVIRHRLLTLVQKGFEVCFHAGDHCQFCKIKSTCRKRAEYAMELAKYEFADAPTLDEDEIAAILPQIDTLVSWAEDVKSWALQQALSGVRYPGFKLVEGRSIRKYTDEAAVAAVVTKAGFDPFEKKLLGITAMQKQLGKKRFY